MNRRPRVYVAGPYTAGTQLEIERNVLNARIASVELWMTGYNPFVPHSNSWNLHDQIPYDVVMDSCFSWIDVCDALYVLPGGTSSAGTMREVAHAGQRGIGVLWSLVEAHTWIDVWRGGDEF